MTYPQNYPQQPQWPSGQPQQAQPVQQPAAPAEPPKKRRKKWPWVVAVLAVIVIIGIVNSGNGASGGSSNSDGAAAPAADAAGIGQSVRDGKFEFTITSITQAKTVGDTQFGGGATAQGTYEIVHVTIKNISDQPQTLSDTDQYLYDAQGRKFSADSSADVWMSNGSSNVLFQQINPGNSVTGQMAFDMPSGDKPVKAELHDSAFSGGATVKLQ